MEKEGRAAEAPNASNDNDGEEGVSEDVRMDNSNPGHVTFVLPCDEVTAML